MKLGWDSRGTKSTPLLAINQAEKKKSPVSEITFGEKGAFSATWTAVRKNIITLVIMKYIHGVREGEVVRPVREMLVIFLKPLLN